MAKPSTKLWTIPEAHRQLRLPGDYRRTKRMLEARERELGKPLMVRGRGPGGRQTLRVTLAAVRLHCPGLSDRDEVAHQTRNVRKYMRNIDMEFRALAWEQARDYCFRDVLPHIRDMQTKITQLEGEIAALKRQIEKAD